MSPLLVLTLASFALGSAQETKRSSRIRFPSEQSPQQQNVGPQIFESESQAVPIIITAGGNGLVNGPHYILSKNPTTINPFGQISPKGYAEGIIIPHTSFHPAQNQEFHQTVPPPIRVPYGMPQSFVMYRQEQANQGIRPNVHQQQQQQQQPERHRFGVPPRPQLPYNQLKQLHPNQHAHHQIFASGMALTKDAQKNPDVAMYRYSIVTNHGKPRPSHPDEFEMEITHGIPEEPFPLTKPNPHPHQNNFNKPKVQHQQKPITNQKPKDSNRFPDFNHGIPDWQNKGSFQDTIPQSNGFLDKNKKGNKPNFDKFPTFENNDDFSGFDDFPEFPQLPNQNNKRFSSQRKPEYERGEVKPLYKPYHEPSINENKRKKIPQKFPPSFETIKSIELVGGEVFSDENISPNFDFQQKPFKNQEKPQTNFNSNQRYPQKSHFKKTQKPQNNQELKFAFNFPQRPDRVKKPQKQLSNQNIDFSFDFPNQKHQTTKTLKKQHKQQQLPPINYNYEFDFHRNQQNKQENYHNSNSGSDWIPINAPEGVVPARSYEIPAPDLSRGSYEDKAIYGRDWHREQEDDEGEEEEDNYRFPSSETVYGVQKGGHTGEEVVSATFRVKQ